MKCQNCTKQAVVHLTEIVHAAHPEHPGVNPHTVEIHLCLDHAVAAGLLTPLAGGAAQKVTIQTLSEKAGQVDAPVAQTQTGLTVVRPADTDVCPVCGMKWSDFKTAGVMGCGHDYEHFAGKLLPLVKRAQEGATEHVGKVPVKRKSASADRQVATLRLRRELQKAVDAENYEQAAQLRDKLRTLEQN